MGKTLFGLSCFTCSLLIMVAAMGHAEVSIHIDNKNGNVEITGAGGVSRMGTVTGCVEGSGKEHADIRDIAAFSEIKIAGIFEVTIDLQKKSSLTVRGDDNILPLVSTEVKGKTLTIRANRSICPKVNLAVQISTEYLDRLTADGATGITITKMNNKEFSATVNGSSDMQISGETGKFFLKIDGTGTVLAENLHAKETEVFIDGAGDAVVYASRKLVAEISGVGDIRYHGNPPEVTKRINGVGEIEQQ